MNNRQKYRRLLLFLLICSILGFGAYGWMTLRAQIPDEIQVSEEGEKPDFFHNAFNTLIYQKSSSDTRSVSNTRVVSESGAQPENKNRTEIRYEITCSLLGVVPVKTVTATVQSREKVYAGGTPIGIYLETDGVLVVNTGKIVTGQGKTCCPSESIIQSGDYIKRVNGETVSTKEELIQCISKCSGKDLVLDVNREGEVIQLKIRPVRDETGHYRAGIWVRNDTQGIGTLTYIRQDGRFGALGHGISDADTGEILKVQGGSLYDADVVSIVRGVQGTPGEVAGVIHYSEGYKIGEIQKNCQEGIYGKLTWADKASENLELYEAAHSYEAVPGEASILSSVDGQRKEYRIEIKEIRINSKDANKGMIIEVTDPKLLELTGGIVQGMSGSPVIQNGRIVGAVTHVLVNDPTRGYGIFIENMLGH